MGARRSIRGLLLWLGPGIGASSCKSWWIERDWVVDDLGSGGVKSYVKSTSRGESCILRAHSLHIRKAHPEVLLSGTTPLKGVPQISGRVVTLRAKNLPWTSTPSRQTLPPEQTLPPQQTLPHRLVFRSRIAALLDSRDRGNTFVSLRAKNLPRRSDRQQLTARQRFASSTCRAKPPRPACRVESPHGRLRGRQQRGRGPEPERSPTGNFEVANPYPIPDAMWQEALMAIASSRRDLYTEFRPKVIAAGGKYRFDELSLEQIGVLEHYDRGLDAMMQLVSIDWDRRERARRDHEAEELFKDPIARDTAARLERAAQIERRYAQENTRGFCRRHRWKEDQ